MTRPALSTAALAQMLRTLAERVESGADVFEVSMETENIGHATKTTITLWALPKPTPAEAELHRRRVQPWRDGTLPAVSQGWCPAWRADIAPSKRCNTFLSANGTCPNEARHR